MNLFPINLDIRGKKVVIVGGGKVATRKCHSLLEAEAAVTVVSPAVTPELADLVQSGHLDYVARTYLPGDLADAVLAYAATNDRTVNRLVADEAKRLLIPVCVTDVPTEGTFTSPSTVRRGDLLITVSTGGKSPALARRIREELEGRYGPEYAAALMLLGRFREKLLTEAKEEVYNKQIFNELLDHDLLRLLKPGAEDALDRLLRELFEPDAPPERPAADTEDPS